jgi:phosphate transport system protein
LNREPQLKQADVIPHMAETGKAMLKDALDSFVNRDADKARAVVPRDKEVDRLNKQFHHELEEFMMSRSDAIHQCLSLMVVSKSLERVADHATNIAEEVVYLYEANDIRHTGKERRRQFSVRPASEFPPNEDKNARGRGQTFSPARNCSHRRLP